MQASRSELIECLRGRLPRQPALTVDHVQVIKQRDCELIAYVSWFLRQPLWLPKRRRRPQRAKIIEQAVHRAIKKFCETGVLDLTESLDEEESATHGEQIERKTPTGKQVGVPQTTAALSERALEALVAKIVRDMPKLGRSLEDPSVGCDYILAATSHLDEKTRRQVVKRVNREFERQITGEGRS